MMYCTYTHTSRQLQTSVWSAGILQSYLMDDLPAVLFTVEAERTAYNSEFGGDVVMGCRFQPKPPTADSKLRVTWHLISASPVQEVHQYQWDNKPEPSTSQEDPSRVKLLTNELQDGWAKLQVQYSN